MFKSAEEVANEAAHAKHSAKLSGNRLAIHGRDDLTDDELEQLELRRNTGS